MKNILLFLSIVVITISCKKEKAQQLPPTVTVSLKEQTAGAILFSSTTGMPIQVKYSLRFEILSDQEVYFSPVPTYGSEVLTATGNVMRPPSSYTVQFEQSGIIDGSMASLACSAVGAVQVTGPSYLVPANTPTQFLVIGILDGAAVAVPGKNYAMRIDKMVLYSDPMLTKPVWRNQVSLKTDYALIGN